MNPQQLFNPSFEGSCYAPTHRSTIHQDIEVTEAFTQAHQMLYNYQLTRWQGDADFRPYSTLTREEAARFMVEFAEKVLCRTKTRKYDGRFVDIGVSNPTLTPFIRASYEYEIFNGDKSDTTTTTFRPKDRLSEEELVVIIVRLITNEILEE